MFKIKVLCIISLFIILLYSHRIPIVIVINFDIRSMMQKRYLKAKTSFKYETRTFIQ